MSYRLSGIMCLVAALTTSTLSLAEDKGEEKAETKKPVKTVEVEIKGGLKLKVPENWKQSKPSSRLRLAQFAIPAAKGDDEDGELALFNFGMGGGARANIERWIGQFQAEEREVKVTEGAIETGKYYFVEISGTYNKPIGPPIARQTRPAPGSRMLGVILGIEDQGVYFMKMTGANKTVAAQVTALRASYGADAKKEKEVDFEK